MRRDGWYIPINLPYIINISFTVLDFSYGSYYLVKVPEFLSADDEDEYEEAEGGNRLLGFMFGNVDGAGDLDIDYLDEVNFFLIMYAYVVLGFLTELNSLECNLIHYLHAHDYTLPLCWSHW